MRVLFLTLHFQPDTVSNAVVVTDLAEDLAARGHQITVVSAMPYHKDHRIEPRYRNRAWSRDVHGNIRVIRTWLYLRGRKADVGRRFLAYASFNVTSTLAALMSGRHDVVVAPSPPLTIGVCAWLVARWNRAKFIYNVQDIYPDAAIKLGLLRRGSTIKFFKQLERFVYARADAVTVISDDFARNLLAKGVPRSKVALAPNPVDTDFVRPLSRDNRFSREQDLVGRFVVLYAGNIGLAQGLETLVEAAGLVTSPAIEIVCVGAGAELEAVRERAERARIGHIRFLPFQPRERVPELYASADVCIVMLRRGMANTSTPSKLFTIMAAGKPVVACVDENSEVWRLVQSVGCGLCVPPQEPRALAAALDSLCADRSNTRALGDRGRAYVERYASRAVVGNLYEQLMTALVNPRDAARDC